MSQADSIFSSPSNSNGEPSANPFASLGGENKVQSPFAAVGATQSPFGLEDGKSSQPAKGGEETSSRHDNPFQSSPSEGATKSGEDSAGRSPFAPTQGFEAPSAQPSAVPVSEPPQEKKAEPQASSQPTGSPFEQGQGASVAQVAASVGSAAPLQAATASPAPAENSSSRGRTRQLELRAIFGVEGEMSREEILKRAKNLPGIRDLAVVGAGEMSALGTLGGVMSRFGYGDSNSWQLTCPGGIVDFVSNENTTLAVMREGRYSAGVWETLMIVARELGQAS